MSEEEEILQCDKYLAAKLIGLQSFIRPHHLDLTLDISDDTPHWKAVQRGT
jgi:hypothetical protein